MYKKLLIFLSFLLTVSYSCAEKNYEYEPDEWLQVAHDSYFAGIYVGDCYDADMLREDLCKNEIENNQIYLSKIPTQKSCIDQAIDFLKKRIGRDVTFNDMFQSKSNFDSIIKVRTENNIAYFNGLKNEFKNEKLACEVAQKDLSKNFDQAYREFFFMPERYGYLTASETDILLGDYRNIQTTFEHEKVLGIFNDHKNTLLKDQRFLLFLANEFAWLYDDEVGIALLKRLSEVTEFTKLKNYAVDQIQQMEIYLQNKGSQKSDFRETLPASLSVYKDLTDEKYLFDIALETYKYYIKFLNETYTSYELMQTIDSYNTPTRGVPFNRLEKLKNDLKTKDIDFELVINIDDIGLKIDYPGNIRKSWLLYAKKITEEPRINNWLDGIIETESENNNSGIDRIYAPSWIKDNKEYSEKYLSKEIFDDIDDLKKITLQYINLYQENISIAVSEDLIYEAHIQLSGDDINSNFYINEYAAQTLAEQALKVSKIQFDQKTEEESKSLLGALFLHSFNPDIKNNRLGKIHVEEALHTWIEDCKEITENFNQSSSLIECNKNQDFRSIDMYSVSNVLKLIYEDENLFDYSAFIPQLHKLYKESNTDGLDHVTINLKKPSAFQDKNNFLSYLDDESKSRHDIRVLDLKCDYMLDRNEIYGIDKIIACYKGITEITEVSDESLVSDSDHIDNYIMIEELEKIKQKKYVTKNVFNIEEYFSYQDNQINLLNQKQEIPKDVKDKAIDEIKEKKIEKKPKSEKRYALLIGNSKYDRELNSPTNDVNSLETSLNKLGFQTFKHHDLNLKEFKNAVVEFGLNAKDADITLFYYSGHAYEIGGLNYLLPVDVNFSNKPNQTIPLSIELNKLMNQNLPGKSKLVFLDACRDNPFNKNGLAVINLGDNTLLSFAAGFNEFAAANLEKGKLSPYTEALNRHIFEKDSITEVLRKVRNDVKKITKNKQVPEEYSNLSDKIVLND